MSLFIKAKIAVLWSFISSFGSLIIQFIFGVVMARLLTPKDFGTMGIAFVFIVISKSITDSGLYQALIQKKDTTNDEFSVVFKFNLIFSIFLNIIIYASAQKISFFFQDDIVGSVLKLLSFLVFIESLSIIQRAILLKHLKFDTIAKAEIISILIGGLVGIYFAYNSYGVHSLVYRTLTQSFLITAIFWIFNPFKINLSVSWKKIFPLFNFGFKIFLADQIENIGNHLATIIIGKKYSSTDLGFYSKADQYQRILTTTPLVAINKVVFPSFSKIQENDEKLKKGYKFLMKCTMMILFPVCFLSILIADNLIIFLIGDQWVESIIYFKLLCLGGMIYPLTIFNLNIIKVKGYSKLYLKTCLITKGLLIPFILIGLNFGIEGMVISIICQQLFAAIINIYISGRLVNYKIFEQLKDILIYFILSFSVYLTLSFLKIKFDYFNFSNFENIVYYSFVFIVSYLLLNIFLNIKDLMFIKSQFLKNSKNKS